MRNLITSPLRTSLLLLAFLVIHSALAYDFKADGVYYQFDGGEVYVASGDNLYSGEVVIPETVTYRGTVYPVSGIYVRAFNNCTELTKVTMGNSIKYIYYCAFKDCANLNEVNFGNSLEGIDGGAFMGCSSLTNITLPNSLTSIGYEAFTNCTNLRTIHLSTSLKAIGQESFKGCINLKSIDLHNGITNIGYGAFMDCKRLKEVTIPDSINYLVDAFKGCTNLTTLNWNAKNARNCHCEWPANIEVINFGEGVQYIPQKFLAGTNIKSVIIPDAVTEIGSGAFDDCQYLEHVTIGKSVLVSTWAGTGLCSNCTNLKSLTWNVINPDPYNSPYPFYIGSRENIEQITFGDCVERIPKSIAGGSKIQSITIPKSAKTIDDGAFAGCSKLSTIVVDQGNQTFDSRDNCNGVVETATNTLVLGCKGTVIPNTVTAIANYAFVMCTELTNIEIPSSVISIGSPEFSYGWHQGPFYGCTGLTSITIPNSVTYVGPYAFSGCTNLSDVVLSESLKEICEKSFEECISLKNVVIPNSVVSIEPYAFQSCSALSDVVLSENLREIGNHAFAYCSALKTINLPLSLRIIDYDAFYESGLESITIPDSVIVDAAAFGYTQIKSVTVSSSARLMGEFIFEGTPWLKNQPSNGLIYADNVLYRYNGYMPEGTIVSIPDGPTGIAGNAFGFQEDEESSEFDPDCIIAVEVPNSVKYIGYWAFGGCSKLQSFTSGKGLEIIGEDAFYDCPELEKVKIGSGIKVIEDKAFYGCPKLVSITCLATTPPAIEHPNRPADRDEDGYECFDEDTYSNAVLFVPKGSEVTYMMADKWKKFIHIVGIDVDPEPCDVNGDGEVNIADINNVVNAILNGDTDERYDANDDGEVNIADINMIVQVILNGN